MSNNYPLIIRDCRAKIVELKQVAFDRLSGNTDATSPDIDNAQVELELAKIALAEAEMALEAKP